MKTIIWLFFFASLPGILGQIDMDGKAFSFYNRRTDHVRLKPATKNFNEFTICLKSCKNLTENHLLVLLTDREGTTLFKMLFHPDNNKKRGANVLIIFKNSSERFDFPKVSKTWINICVTVNLVAGNLVLMVNGNKDKHLHLGGSKESHIYAKDIILGRYNDFQNTNVVPITNVNMWSSALSTSDVKKFIKEKQGGDIINWRSLVVESSHSVSIEKPKCVPKN